MRSANEVESNGSRSIACLNSRDRNLLGIVALFDGARTYGVDQFLLVHGRTRHGRGKPHEQAVGPGDDRGGPGVAGERTFSAGAVTVSDQCAVETRATPVRKGSRLD